MAFILHEEFHLFTKLFLTRKKIRYLYILHIFCYCEDLEKNNKY